MIQHPGAKSLPFLFSQSRKKNQPLFKRLKSNMRRAQKVFSVHTFIIFYHIFLDLRLLDFVLGVRLLLFRATRWTSTFGCVADEWFCVVVSSGANGAFGLVHSCKLDVHGAAGPTRYENTTRTQPPWIEIIGTYALLRLPPCLC